MDGDDVVVKVQMATTTATSRPKTARTIWAITKMTKTAITRPMLTRGSVLILLCKFFVSRLTNAVKF